MKLLPVLLITVCALAAAGEPRSSIPEPLAPWTRWVMEKDSRRICVTDSAFSAPVCIWGGELDLRADGKGLRFRQDWTVFTDAYVPLPGGNKCWPEKVSDGKKELAVTLNNGRPSVYLHRGDHRLSGIINCKRLPEFIELPRATVLVAVQLNEKRITTPDIDSKNNLWFGRNNQTQTEATERDEVHLTVFRKISDGEPVTITTHLRMEVSGKPRELITGQFLPDNSRTLSLVSPLPARIEKDGSLRIQIRAGQHDIILTSRCIGTADTIRVTGHTAPWPEEEIWSFEANNNIRIVKVLGGSQIDPSQSTMPAGWRSYPAYYMEQGTPLILTETHRGDWAPLPDDLQLRRELWLDFNGHGITARDRISGTVYRSTRLSTEEDCTPGSVELNGVPQVITISDDSIAGIEVKQGSLEMTAVSRYAGNSGRLSLSGWKHAFKRVSTTLHLPPGWRILGTIGIHQSNGSWVTSWNLWELFLAFILIASLVRLAGIRTGVIGALAFALSFQEPGAPVYSWIVVITGFALLKASVFIGRKRLLTIIFTLCMLYMAGVALMFSISSFRLALYPQLEVTEFATDFFEKVSDKEVQELVADEIPQLAKPSVRRSSRSTAYGKQQAKKQYDLEAKIQTGPGIPRWNWKSAYLGNEGPVDASETMTIIFIPPFVTRAINIISPLAILLLLYLLASAAFKRKLSDIIASPLMKRTSAAMLFPLLLLLPHSARADFPPEHLLNDLEQRLVRAIPCTTSCAAMHRGSVVASGDMLTIELTVGAQRVSAFRLPFSKVWTPSSISLSGTENKAVFSKGASSCILVPEGVSSIVMKGRLQHDRTVISFPFTVHNMVFRSTGWTAQGLIDGTVPDRSLVLDRKVTAQQTTQQETKLFADPPPVFCTVVRHIEIDNEWRVTTTIRRIAPQSGAISLTIPLITGEAIITPHIEVVNDSVIAGIPDGANQVSWESRLERNSRIELTAAQNETWREQWSIRSTTKWHLESDGFNPVRIPGSPGASYWYPRPAEKLLFSISRPEALPGRTHTIEEASLVHTPGKKSSETSLALVVKSSQGEKIRVRLPADARLNDVLINDRETTISHSGDSVELPLTPGTQRLKITWKSSDGVSLFTRSPRPSINEQLSNINCSIHVPRDRWLLYATGPLLGPAVQFWGILIAMIILALILGITRCTPLKSLHWILLFTGMSTVSNPGALFVVLWFLLLTYKEKHSTDIPQKWYNPLQVLIIILALGSLVSLVVSIPLGLLSSPAMQVSGNGSGRLFLRWYQDQASGTAFPQGTFISLPLWVYRLVMLAWSLWLAIALPGWIKWAWNVVWRNGIWKKPVPPAKNPKAPSSPPKT